MRCNEIDEILEQQDGAGLPTEAAAHLNDCGRCRAMVSDLQAIRAVAHDLGAHEPEPPERVWLTLRGRLESEDLIHESRKSSWRAGWFDFRPRFALAGAYLAALLVAALLIGTHGKLDSKHPTLTAETQSSVALLPAQLKSVERSTVSAIRPQDPLVTASLRKNLDIVDNAIALCEKSVHEEPQNELAREYLYGAYQQKAELLAVMADRTATGD